MALEQELEFYQSQKQALLQTHKGQFALIKGEKLLGAYTTFEEAFNAGVAAVGAEPFLIKEVTEQDERMHVGLDPARVEDPVSDSQSCRTWSR